MKRCLLIVPGLVLGGCSLAHATGTESSTVSDAGATRTRTMFANCIASTPLRRPGWAGALRDANALQGPRVFGTRTETYAVQLVREALEVRPGVPGPSSTSNGLGPYHSLRLFRYDGAWTSLGLIAGTDDPVRSTSLSAVVWNDGYLVYPSGEAGRAGLCDASGYRSVTVPRNVASSQLLSARPRNGSIEFLLQRAESLPGGVCPPSGPLEMRPRYVLEQVSLRAVNSALEPIAPGVRIELDAPRAARCATASGITSAVDGDRSVVRTLWCRSTWGGDYVSMGRCVLGAARFDGTRWTRLPELSDVAVSPGQESRIALRNDSVYLSLSAGEHSGFLSQASLWTWRDGANAWVRGVAFPPGRIEWLGFLPGSDALTALVLRQHAFDGQTSDRETQAFQLRDGRWVAMFPSRRARGRETIAPTSVLDDGTFVIVRDNYEERSSALFRSVQSGWEAFAPFSLRSLVSVP